MPGSTDNYKSRGRGAANSGNPAQLDQASTVPGRPDATTVSSCVSIELNQREVTKSYTITLLIALDSVHAYSHTIVELNLHEVTKS